MLTDPEIKGIINRETRDLTGLGLDAALIVTIRAMCANAVNAAIAEDRRGRDFRDGMHRRGSTRPERGSCRVGYSTDEAQVWGCDACGEKVAYLRGRTPPPCCESAMAKLD